MLLPCRTEVCVEAACACWHGEGAGEAHGALALQEIQESPCGPKLQLVLVLVLLVLHSWEREVVVFNCPRHLLLLLGACRIGCCCSLRWRVSCCAACPAGSTMGGFCCCWWEDVCFSRTILRQLYETKGARLFHFRHQFSRGLWAGLQPGALRTAVQHTGRGLHGAGPAVKVLLLQGLLVLLLRGARHLGLLLQGGHLLVLWVLAAPGVERQAAQCLNEDELLIPASHSTLQCLMLAPELCIDGQQLLVLILLVPCLLLQGRHLVRRQHNAQHAHTSLRVV